VFNIWGARQSADLLAKELTEGTVKNFGLTVSAYAYEGFSLDRILEVKRRQSERVHPLIEDLWENPEVYLLVVEGVNVFTYSGDIEAFDGRSFARGSSFKPLIIHRPVRVTSPLIK
jgi:hypothetical protein